ncbi:KilA-N domain-containing protein [Nostoc sp. CHAB 5784]|uniref:KilA-N domain-containing protein n=1 Tax=Nostoc mirabile TaxID=2907820 RepID=UPI001E411F6F|nr:KilA-N domain-containing protein [Nostoc mirabile]MCC5670099.1 KilA-N domain-containing protein [Nostoc mirabile CHAB5784]
MFSNSTIIMIDIYKVSRDVNGVIVDQRVSDGFINGTAMCVAHGKNIADWLRQDSAFDLVAALADRLGILPNYGKSHNFGKTRVSEVYPNLVIVKRGSPELGGGTWIHHKLAVHLGQWCSPAFALQVSDWIEEWLPMEYYQPYKTIT